MPPGEDPFQESLVPQPWLLAGVDPEGGAADEGRFRFTIERGIYLSIIAHLLIFIWLMVAPPPKPRVLSTAAEDDPLGLIRLMTVPEAPPPIPVQFFPAPGPKVEKPGKDPLPSDMNRIAQGGAPELPKAEVPESKSEKGIQDLEKGDDGARPPASAPPPAAAAPRIATAARREQPDGKSWWEKPVGPAEPRANEGLPQTSPEMSKIPPVSDAVPKRLTGIGKSVLEGITAEEALRAASKPGSEKGAGFEKPGGFVDNGPISFDTAEYDWGPYAAEMIRRIKFNWDVPQLAYYGIKGWVIVRFVILKDGKVESAKIIASSQTPPFDNAALQAVLKSNPFRALPKDLGKDKEGVTVTFIYNMTPAEAEIAIPRQMMKK